MLIDKNEMDTPVRSLVSLIQFERSEVDSTYARSSWKDNYLTTPKFYIPDLGIKITKCIDSAEFLAISLFMTFYALYAEDFRKCVVEKEYDDAFYVCHITCAVYFTLEMICFIIAEKDYVKSLPIFWDILALSSLIMDIIQFDGAHFNVDGAQFDARAARVTRVATRIGRIVRALHVLKSFKKNAKQDDMYEITDVIDKDNKDVDDADSKDNQFRFGQRLNVLLSRKVIIMCLSMAVVLPLSHANLDDTEQISFVVKSFCDDLARCLNRVCTTDNQKQVEVHEIVYQLSPFFNEWYPDVKYLNHISPIYKEPLMHSLISFKYSDKNVSNIIFDGKVELVNQYQLDRLRNTDTARIEINNYGPNKLNFVFDISKVAGREARDNILHTTILISVLIIGVIMLGQDTVKHVIVPVQKMLECVQKLAHDPFYFWEIYGDSRSEENKKAESEKSKLEQGEFSCASPAADTNQQDVWDGARPEHEIHVLYTTVLNISQLLALGFGRAGWNIIRKTVSGGLNKVDYYKSGSRINGIFAFSDIRNFTDITECLDKNVIVFVNDVAKIVHSNTVFYNGAINKNVGDAFLCAWTFPKKVVIEGKSAFIKDITSSDTKSKLKQIPIQIMDLTVRAMICTIKIYLDINRSTALERYSHHPLIMKRFPEGYHPRLGMGLHCGWGIEGLLGSKHKIDVTYLSPHVNISMELESRTKVYKIPILLSGAFVQFLPPIAKRLCRPVDYVTMTGQTNSTVLYTVDVPNPKLCKPNEAPLDQKTNLVNEEINTISKEVREWRILFTNSCSQLNMDCDIVFIRQYQSSIKKFTDMYRNGFNAYKNGDWYEAFRILSSCLILKKSDGPTIELLRYMNSLDNKPPTNWRKTGKVW